MTAIFNELGQAERMVRHLQNVNQYSPELADRAGQILDLSLERINNVLRPQVPPGTLDAIRVAALRTMAEELRMQIGDVRAGVMAHPDDPKRRQAGLDTLRRDPDQAALADVDFLSTYEEQYAEYVRAGDRAGLQATLRSLETMESQYQPGLGSRTSPGPTITSGCSR